MTGSLSFRKFVVYFFVNHLQALGMHLATVLHMGLNICSSLKTAVFISQNYY